MALQVKDLKISNDALGIGSYGKVVRAKLGKLQCAAKLLHDTMFQFNDPGIQNLVRKFKEECDLLSNIDHPNIVKYLCSTQDPKSGRPVLLMELMHESLTKFLERSPCPISYYSQFSIGHDIALALVYLHSKSTVHRDLSSNNILLTEEGTAKVTDFGMSRLIEMHPRATPLTQCPGTLAYMPPEALITPPQYSDKLDCFSYGVLIIQISTKKFPDPGDANKYVEDPKYPTGRVIVPIPEIERRRKHIDLVEQDHPLLPLAIKCLKDRDTERPSARELCEQLAPLVEKERQKKEQEEREQQIRKELEERERQQTRAEEQRERQRKKELEEKARREEKQRRKKEKEGEKFAKKEAKASSGGALSLSWPFSTSKKPRRFVEGGFDLDLTYIKPNIVAMAFPCVKLEGLIRNNINDVVRFFDTKHPDHYKVYNLCSEREYDPGRFHLRVVTYPFDEDNAPPFELIKPFCDDLDVWLKADDRNVAVIHCNDGLGRTGVVICAYFLHDKVFDTAKDALQFYGEARATNAKGVIIPSQRRYVQYYGHLIRNCLNYSPKTVLLEAIVFEGIPQFARGGCSPHFSIRLYKTRIYMSRVYDNIRSSDEYADLGLPQPVPLCGDIHILFYHQMRIIFHFWFNTYFVDMHVMQEAAKLEKDRLATGMGNIGISSCGVSDTNPVYIVLQSYSLRGFNCIALTKSELDKANEDSKHFPPNFKVHVVVSEVTSTTESSHEDFTSALSDSEYDEEDVSDTDEEESWETFR